MTGKNVLALIPARGGSKGIPKKNIKKLDGQPLISYSIRAGLNARIVDSVIVSTDDKEIARVSESYGARVPFIRPAELAADETATAPVITHALDSLENIGELYDVIILLQPTSPLRTATHIEEAYEMYDNTNTESVISAYSSKDIRWKYRHSGAKKINYKNAPKRRQDRDPEYIVNGAVYITSVESFRDTGTLTAGKTDLYEMDEIESVDIDKPFDLWLAEKILTEWKNHD